MLLDDKCGVRASPDVDFGVRRLVSLPADEGSQDGYNSYADYHIRAGLLSDLVALTRGRSDDTRMLEGRGPGMLCALYRSATPVPLHWHTICYCDIILDRLLEARK